MDDLEKKSACNTFDWGCLPYAKALTLQQDWVSQRLKGDRTDSLVLTEHEPVYTLGRRPKAEQHLIWDSKMLESQGIAVEHSTRGGDITYHGPGQIVGYPIIGLENSRDVHAYVRKLEEVLIRSLAHFDLQAERREGKTGVWLEKRKIAAIGIAVKRWVTYHGFALNVNNSLEPFSGILPCGITDGTVTSMRAECGVAFDLGRVKNILAMEFWKLFGHQDNCENKDI